MTSVAAVILAAGGSRRFGSPKALHRCGGATLVRRAVDAAESAGCRPVLVVAGALERGISEELGRTGAVVVGNPEWEEGMASSIRAGIARLRATAPGPDAAIVMLADQPRVDEAILGLLIERLERGPEPAAACRYEGILGPPAIFSKSVFFRLEELTGDEGARNLLRTGAISAAAIEFPDGAFDVDSPKS
jgi:molybdenum cofactor cytidylyltransferase